MSSLTMSAIEESEESEGTGETKPAFCGVMATSDMMCHSKDLEVLAFADTVEDIVPKNHMSRYLKAKYETHSIQDSEDNISFLSRITREEDDSTLNTFNTNINTLDTTFDHLMDQSVDHTLDQSLDPKRRQTLDHTIYQMKKQTPDEKADPKNNTFTYNTDGTVEIEPTTRPSNPASSNVSNRSLQTLETQKGRSPTVKTKPQFILHESQKSPHRRNNKKSEDATSKDLNSTSINSTLNSTFASTADSLKFSAWNVDGEHEDEDDSQSSSSGSSFSSSRSIPSRRDDDTSADANADIARRRVRTNDSIITGGETATGGSVSTGRSSIVKAIGKTMKRTIEPKKKFHFPRVGSKKNRGKDKKSVDLEKEKDEIKDEIKDEGIMDGEIEVKVQTAREIINREKRRQEMRDILEATTKSNSNDTIEMSRRKKVTAALKKSVKGAMGSFRSPKSKK